MPSTLLEMSLGGSCIILVAIVLRTLFLHRVSKRLFFWLWMAALLRLLLPAFPASPVSVFAHWQPAPPAAQSAVEAVQEATAPQAQTAPEAAKEAAAPQTAPEGAPSAALPGASQPDAQAGAPDRAPRSPLAWVWMGGFTALLALTALSYVRGLRRFRASRPFRGRFIRDWRRRHALRRRVEVRLCAAVDSPLTYGVLRPVILLPESAASADAQALSHALEHEWAHVRHFDALWKLLIALAACLHWFNPLVWAMAVVANRDLELYSDERVLRRFGDGERRAYARTLLRMEQMRASIPPLINAFSKNSTEERIGAIMKQNKRSIVATLLTLAVMLASLSAFAAAPEASPPSEGTSAQAPAAQTPSGESAAEPTYEALLADVQEAAASNAQYRGLPAEDLAAYEPYGLSRIDGRVRYRGVPVRVFEDFAAGILALQGDGGVDVCAVRDEDGILTGLRASTEEEFALRSTSEPAILAYWYATGEDAADAYVAPPAQWPLPGAETLRASLDDYAAHGLRDAGGAIAYEGASVRVFVDEAAALDVVCAPDGIVDVYAVRDEAGTLTGLRPATQEEYARNTQQRAELSAAQADLSGAWEWFAAGDAQQGGDAEAMPAMYTADMLDGALQLPDATAALGVDVAQSGYDAFGLRVHQGLLYYEGRFVRCLLDEAAGVEAIYNGGDIDLYAVRDEGGNLTGLRAATQEEYDQNTQNYQLSWS